MTILLEAVALLVGFAVGEIAFRRLGIKGWGRLAYWSAVLGLLVASVALPEIHAHVSPVLGGRISDAVSAFPRGPIFVLIGHSAEAYWAKRRT